MRCDYQGLRPMNESPSGQVFLCFRATEFEPAIGSVTPACGVRSDARDRHDGCRCSVPKKRDRSAGVRDTLPRRQEAGRAAEVWVSTARGEAQPRLSLPFT